MIIAPYSDVADIVATIYNTFIHRFVLHRTCQLIDWRRRELRDMRRSMMLDSDTYDAEIAGRYLLGDYSEIAEVYKFAPLYIVRKVNEFAFHPLRVFQGYAIVLNVYIQKSPFAYISMIERALHSLPQYMRNSGREEVVFGDFRTTYVVAPNRERASVLSNSRMSHNHAKFHNVVLILGESGDIDKAHISFIQNA